MIRDWGAGKRDVCIVRNTHTEDQSIALEMITIIFCSESDSLVPLSWGEKSLVTWGRGEAVYFHDIIVHVTSLLNYNVILEGYVCWYVKTAGE